jgi:magnesium-transporting ATPase (P-type)
LKLGAILTDSFNYTKLLFNDIGRLLMLMIFSVIPVVNLIVLGYLGNVMKQPKDSKQLPQLDNYVELLIQGLKMGIVTVIYMIIPLVIAMSTYDIFGFFSFMPDIRGNAAFLLIITGLLLALFISIILAMALVNMARHDYNFNEAFAVGALLERIKEIGWVKCILGVIVIGIGIGIITYLVQVIFGSSSLLRFIIMALLTPFFGVFIARSASLAYMEEAPAQETAAPTEQT